MRSGHLETGYVPNTRYLAFGINCVFVRMRADDFPFDLYSLQLDELNILPEPDEPGDSRKTQVCITKLRVGLGKS